MSGIRNVLAVYLRTIVFGISDGTVSTVGLLAGVAIAGSSAETLKLTGVVYAFIEAFSMAAGAYLSEESVEEYAKHGDVPERLPVTAGVVMFTTFVLSSLVEVVPYFFFSPIPAVIVSFILSIGILFVVGVLSARVARVAPLTRGWRTALLGGVAIVIGVTIGALYPHAGLGG